MKTIKQFKNIHDHIFASIFCAEDQEMLMDVWSIQYRNDEKLKSVFEYCFEKIEEQRIQRWLCDEKKLEAFLQQENLASRQSMQNIIKHSELQKVSLVCRNPQESAAHISRDFIASCGVEVDIFRNNVMAMRWLTDNQSALQGPHLQSL